MAANTKDWKLVFRRPAPDSEAKEPSIELYEIGNDPYEKLDISNRSPKSVKKRAQAIAVAKAKLTAEIETFQSLKSENQIDRYSRGAGNTPTIPDWTPTH